MLHCDFKLILLLLLVHLLNFMFILIYIISSLAVMLLINIMQSLKESFIIFDRQLLINFGDFIILIFDDV